MPNFSAQDIMALKKDVAALMRQRVPVDPIEDEITYLPCQQALDYFQKSTRGHTEQLTAEDKPQLVLDFSSHFDNSLQDLNRLLETSPVNGDEIKRVIDELEFSHSKLQSLLEHNEFTYDSALVKATSEPFDERARTELQALIVELTSNIKPRVDSLFHLANQELFNAAAFYDYSTVNSLGSENGAYETTGPAPSGNTTGPVPPPQPPLAAVSSIAINASGSRLAPNNVKIYGYLVARDCPAQLWPTNIPKVPLSKEQIGALDSAQGLQLFMPKDEKYTLRRANGQFTASYEKEVNLTNEAQVSTIVNMIDNLVAQSTNEPISLTIQSADAQFQTVAKEYLAMLKQAGKNINCTLNNEEVDFTTKKTEVLDSFEANIKKQSPTLKDLTNRSNQKLGSRSAASGNYSSLKPPHTEAGVYNVLGGGTTTAKR